MDRVPLPLLALVLLLAPISGFWTVGWLSGALLLIPLIALCAWLWFSGHGIGPFSPPPGLGALLFLIGWGLLQMIPMPLFLIKIFSPHAWQIYHQSVEVLSPSLWVPLSLNPQGTLQAILILCAGSACYFLSFCFFKNRGDFKLGVLWLTGIVGGLAMGMIFLRLLVLLIPKVISPGHKLAAILNLDLGSIALLMLMLGPLGLSALLAFRPAARYGSWLERIGTYWQMTMQDHFLIIALSALVVPFGIGLLNWQILFFYLGALAVLGLLVIAKRKIRKDVPYIVFFMVVALLALVLGLNSGSIPQKPGPVASVSKTDDSVVSQLTSNYFLTGSGVGTSSKIYHRVDQQAAKAADPVRIAPLRQGRIEGGLPFILGIIWFVYSFLRHSWPKWRKRRNKIAIYLFIGSLSGLVAFAGVIISLRVSVPSWLWYYVFVLAGIVVGSSQATHQTSADRDFVPVLADWRLPLGRLLTSCILVVTVFVLGGNTLAKGLFTQAQASPKEIAQNPLNGDAQSRLLSHAVFFDPLNAAYRWALGWRLIQLGQTDTAMTCFAKALRLDPLVGIESYRLGIYMADAGHGDLAIKMMHHGLQSDRGNQSMQADFVRRLLIQGGQTDALAHVGRILAQDPSKTLNWLYFFDQQGFSPLQGAKILADHPRCLVDYGDFLLQKDLPEQALDSYNAALHLIQIDDIFQPDVVWRLTAFFESRSQYEEALAAVLAGGRVYPENLEYMKASGLFYERLGITFKAAEIYRQILMHTPHDSDIRQRLSHLQK
jgi:tetratricopeptide (TPR) repeat protein